MDGGVFQGQFFKSQCVFNRRPNKELAQTSLRCSAFFSSFLVISDKTFFCTARMFAAVGFLQGSYCIFERQIFLLLKRSRFVSTPSMAPRLTFVLRIVFLLKKTKMLISPHMPFSQNARGRAKQCSPASFFFLETATNCFVFVRSILLGQ